MDTKSTTSIDGFFRRLASQANRLTQRATTYWRSPMSAPDYNIIRTEANGTKIAVCPPHGDTFPVNSSTFTEVRNGHTYHFCSQGCKDLFDTNPEGFIKELDKKMDAARASYSKAA